MLMMRPVFAVGWEVVVPVLCPLVNLPAMGTTAPAYLFLAVAVLSALSANRKL
jgi:hypothetical protein